MRELIDDFYQINVINPNTVTIAELTAIAHHSDSDYIFLSLKTTPVKSGLYALQRMTHIADDTHAILVYADHYSMKGGNREKHPVIDYQQGSIRDDFDFGQIVLLRTSMLKDYLSQDNLVEYKFAQWYDLRLYLSRHGSFFHINEYLYTEEEKDLRLSGVKQFDYVDPRNRDRQMELETIARSEEHTSDSSHQIISYAVFCLKKKKRTSKRKKKKDTGALKRITTRSRSG